MRILSCIQCQGEGRIFKSKYGGNDPDVWDAGQCEACEGSGKAEHVREHITAMGRKPSACHCGKDGHALNSVNCPVHGKRWQDAERKKFRAALESIAGWRNVNISGEYEHGLRDIIRAVVDCAVTALEASAVSSTECGGK